jgi:hypothetical protein
VRFERKEKKILEMKMMRNQGNYHPVRTALYPEELDDMEYSDYMHRGLSAGSSSMKYGASKLC